MNDSRTWTRRFSDTDPFGVARYPRIVDALHETLHETSDVFMEEVGFPFRETSREEGVRSPARGEDFRVRGAGGGRRRGRHRTDAVARHPERQVRVRRAPRRRGGVLGGRQRVRARQGGGGSLELPDDLRAAMAGYADD